MFGLQSSEKTHERGHETQHESQQQYPSKMEDSQYQQQQTGRTKHQTEGIMQVASRTQTKPGRPQIGVIIAGFPSSLAKDLAKECVRQGLYVSNIGLCCRQSGGPKDSTAARTSQQQQQEKESAASTSSSSRGEQETIQGISKMELVDCDSQDARDFLERARDALEKEGAEVVVVLDVSNDCRSIETYNRLKLPFVHSGSEIYEDELKMKEQTSSARNACVLSPFIPLEAGRVQLMLEQFARLQPGVFRGWTLDCDDHMSTGSTVGAAKRRTMNALSYLIDQDPSSFSKWSSGKGSLFRGEGNQQQQQQQQRMQHEHDPHHEKEKEGGGGLMSKLGLGSALSSAKETVKETVQSATTATIGSRSSFTLRSPDGNSSFSIGHEQYELADVCGILQMAEFLADKIDKQREPRVWGLKDWVPGVDDLNRQIAECCEHIGGDEERGIQTETQVYLKGGSAGRQRRQPRRVGQQAQFEQYRERREPTGHSLQAAQQQNVNDPTRNYPTNQTGATGEGTLLATDVTSATTVEGDAGGNLRAKGTAHQ